MPVDGQVAGFEAVDVETLGPVVAGLQLRMPAAAREVAAVLLEPETVGVGSRLPGLGDVDDHVRSAQVWASPATERDRACPRAGLEPRVRLDQVAVLGERLRPARVAVGDDARRRHDVVRLSIARTL
jgi:hypothetical protein